MHKNIPLYPLRFFEAAARHCSFLKAAHELCVTPAAVAHQIRQLESSLGVALFERLPRGVILSAQGRDFLLYVQQALDTLQQGYQRTCRKPQRQSIKIVAMHAFMEKWLLPRIPAFHARHPDIGIELRTNEKPINLHQESAQLWVSYSDNFPCGACSEFLFAMRMAPVCSAQLAARWDKRRLLNEAHYLHDVFWPDDWSVWLNQYAQHLCYDTSRAMRFDLYNMVVQAAVNGMGLAIGYDALVQQEVAQGDLVFPFADFCASPKGFYLNVPSHAVSEDVEIFVAWLRAEAEEQRQKFAHAH